VNDTALDFVKKFWATGRPLGSICHGPQVLISAKLLEGVTLTCFIGIRDDVQNVGATFVDQEVCIDGQLITSRTPDDLPAFNEAFAKALAGDTVSEAEKELSPLEALQVAASREKGAQDFYAEMANVAQEEAVQNKFKYLSAIEEGHFLQLSDLYKQLSGEEPTVDIKQNELGKHRVSADITSQEAVDLAIWAEEKAYEFYRHAASKSQGGKIKEMFEYLAAEELEHKRLFLVDKAAAQGGQGHFQWATHFDIPPGMDDLW
jgi:rubrerythrin